MADGTPFALFDAAIVCKIKLRKKTLKPNIWTNRFCVLLEEDGGGSNQQSWMKRKELSSCSTRAIRRKFLARVKAVKFFLLRNLTGTQITILSYHPLFRQ